MKVLIVSFDKTLTDELKEALADQEVYIAKNSEEAIKMIPSDIEGVIYDAISGAISEEDINTLYTKKFSNARYVILYDELFPVDENNIVVPQKLLIPREENPKTIVSKLVEFPQEETTREEKPVQEGEVSYEPELEIEGTGTESVEELVQEIEESPEFEIEPTSYETPSYEESQIEESLEIEGGVEEALQELETTQEEPVEPAVEEVTEIQEEQKREEPQQVAQQSGTGKILIVSFDQTLIDSIKASFGREYEVVSVKTVKQAIEQGSDASIVIFDAISGVIAEKGLIELSENDVMSGKPYVILVDDLFPINVEGIPLTNKVSLSRDADPSRIKEVIEENLSSVASTKPTAEGEAPQEIPKSTEEEEKVEEVVSEEPIETLTAEETNITEQETIEEAEEDIESIVSQEIPEMEIEEEVFEETPQEVQEEEIPALEALEKVIEESVLDTEEETQGTEEVAEEVLHREVAEPQPQLSISGADIDKLVESAVAKALSEDKIREAVSKAFEERMLDIRDMVADVVRKEVEKVFEELDIRNLIRQATYQALKDRLEELIT